MDTKKFNSNEKSRGGKNNTKTVLTAAGLSAITGVASGAIIALKFAVKKKDDKDDKPQDENPATSTLQEETQQETAQQTQNSQQATQPQQNSSSNGNITTPHPVDSSSGSGQVPQPSPQQPSPQQPTHPQDNPSGSDEINPDLIAQQIAGSNETDPSDIEAPDILTVDGMDLAYGPDGSEFTVAMVHTPDGGQYMLADVDGDGIFSDVFDLNGNYVGAAEGNLTASDLQEAADPTGGYMAYNGAEPIGEDPTNDIVATDTSTNTPTNSGTQHPEENLLASNDEEAVDLDDLLAQLLSNNEDSLSDVASREMVVDDTYISETEESDEDSEDDDEEIDEDEIDDDNDDE